MVNNTIIGLLCCKGENSRPKGLGPDLNSKNGPRPCKYLISLTLGSGFLKRGATFAHIPGIRVVIASRPPQLAASFVVNPRPLSAFRGKADIG
jgi:hypothetical protein